MVAATEYGYASHRRFRRRIRWFHRRINLPRLEVSGTFNEEESLQSNTAREIIGYTRAIEVAAIRAPQELKESVVLLFGDSQAAIAALRKFDSPSSFIHEQLARLFWFCSSSKFDIIPIWIPRFQLTDADKLSRRPDASYWGFTADQVKVITAHFGVRIALDFFASETHHVVDKYISVFYTRGCIAVHALACDWREFLAANDATAWVVPPFKSLSAALSAIQRFKVDAIIIMPTRTASNERIHVQNLTGVVSAPFYIAKQAIKCRPSLRVPASTIDPILMGLTAFYVNFSGKLSRVSYVLLSHFKCSATSST
jgi:hypothetical protein